MIYNNARWHDPLTRIISTQGDLNIINVFDIELINGTSIIPSGYLYRSSIIR